MKVLFFESHQMWIHGLPNGFRDAGHTVKVSGPLSKQRIKTLIHEFQPDLIVTMGWTLEHTEEKRLWLRKYIKRAHVPHVFWATEDPTHTESFSLPYITAVRPDFVFTISRERVEDYRRLGIPAAHLDFGFHRSVHRPNQVKIKKYNLAVVANAYPKILEKYPNHKRVESLHRLIRPLLNDKMRIDFWGREWGLMRRYLGVDIPKAWIHGYLQYAKAHEIYNASKIVLGLQNKPSQLTQRTFEILGSGGFLLTSDTQAIRALFKPGVHLVVSDSPKKTLKLVQYYLSHPKERERIRQAGRRAVEEHSYKQRALEMIRVLKAHGILPGTALQDSVTTSRTLNPTYPSFLRPFE